LELPEQARSIPRATSEQARPDASPAVDLAERLLSGTALPGSVAVRSSDGSGDRRCTAIAAGLMRGRRPDRCAEWQDRAVDLASLPERTMMPAEFANAGRARPRPGDLMTLLPGRATMRRVGIGLQAAR
jgi:hypothetical protein